MSLAAAVAMRHPVLAVAAAVLTFATLVLDMVAQLWHMRAQALGRLAGPNLGEMLGEVGRVELPLTVRSAAHRSPGCLPSLATTFVFFGGLTAGFMLVRVQSVLWWVFIGLLSMMLVVTLVLGLAKAIGRPLVMMDQARLRMPALKVDLAWDEIEAIHLTAPQVVSWIGSPIGFAVRPRTPVGPRFIRAVMRRQQGWLFLVDWQMDTPPEVVVATALRLHAAFCRSRVADSRP